MENELIFLAPDAIEAKLVGKIISKFEEAGFKIVKMKKGRMSKQLAKLMYVETEEYFKGRGEKTLKSVNERNESLKSVREIFGTLDPTEMGRKIVTWKHEYVTSGDIIGVVLQGKDAPKRVREIIGYTDPSKADKGTIRGDWGTDSIYKANLEKRCVKNLLHASDEERAAEEISLFEKYFFKD